MRSRAPIVDSNLVHVLHRALVLCRGLRYVLARLAVRVHGLARGLRIARVRPLAAGLVLGGLTLAARPAHAQLEELLARAAPEGMEATDEELDAFWALIDEQYVTARERAAKILEEDPESYVAHYVLGRVEHDAEGNFPRAVFHFKNARRLYEAEHSVEPEPGQPWRWHSRILQALAHAQGQLENHETKLALIEKYNEVYDPDQLAEQAWPLMKLRRFDEARKAAERGLATGDPRQEEIALNAMCAIEFEAGNNLRSYAACKKALDHARERGTGLDPVDLLNFAEASRSVFKLDEAERVDLEALEYGVIWYGNPWSELSELYIRQGRLAEALSTLREVPAYRAQRPPHARESDRNENRRALASFFVVMGRAKDALRITQKALVAPDRRAHNSRDPLQDRTVTALLDREAHQIRAERLLENAVGRPLWERVWALGQAQLHRLQAWASGRRAVRAVSEGDRLAGTFRIGTAEAAIMPPWLAGDLVTLVGPGVGAQAVREARRGDARPSAVAYYDAFAGEAALRDGDLEVAEERLSSALARLGAAERLLRARVLALRAQVHEARGRVGEAARDLERTLDIDPGVLRRLGMVLDVRLEVSGDETAEAIADGLARSPRLEVGDGLFRVRVQADRQRAEACLLTSNGAVMGCGRAQAGADDDAQAVADRALQDFHAVVFSPRVDLSQADAHSLDGSNLGKRGQDLDDLLGQ